MNSGAVSVSELKANLSRYLREVRRGGEVQVTDRGTPVARLVPVAQTDDAHLNRLITSGVLRAGQGDAAAVLDEPPLHIPTSLSAALAVEREDRA